MDNKELIRLAIVGAWAKIDELDKRGGIDAELKKQKYIKYLEELAAMAQEQLEEEF
jgi:hypothetical protein